MHRVISNFEALGDNSEFTQASFSLANIFDGIDLRYAHPNGSEIGHYCDYLIYNMEFDYKKNIIKSQHLYKTGK